MRIIGIRIILIIYSFMYIIDSNLDMNNIITLITKFIEHYGYFSVLILMIFESCNIPIPSEVVLPVAGFFAFEGIMNFYVVAIISAIACTIGSVISYYLGSKLGRDFLYKYGKYIFLKKEDIDYGEKLLKKYGNSVAFFSRMLPIIRTFISFPAGLLEVSIVPFIILTFTGSLIWSFFLEYIGVLVRGNLVPIENVFHKLDIAVVVIVVLAISFFVYKKFNKNKAL